MEVKNSLVDDLRAQIQGEVRDDAISLAVYSVDASIFEIAPLAIALPRTKQELVAAVRTAASHQVPVIPRGAATGIAGGCIGRGLVLDTSKYLNQILSLDPVKQTACCEPGVVQNQLNSKAAPHGLRLGPDTSTGNRATVGGMLANNSAGARSLRYGKMVDAVIEVELLLANGQLLRFGPVDELQLAAKLELATIEGDIYREVVRIRSECADEIRQRFPQMPRRASGYNLDALLEPGPLNIAKLIAGSEGSLGIATEITMRLAPLPQSTTLYLLHFHTLDEAFQAVEPILNWHPQALELIDDKIINAGRSSPALAGRTAWIEGDPLAMLIVEFEGDRGDFLSFARQAQLGYHVRLADTVTAKDVWAVRESGLGLLLSKRSYRRAIAFLEDVAVPPHQLPLFMRDFLQLLRDHGKEAGVYGHVGAGCMHIRPYIDLRDPHEQRLMEHLMRETAVLLLRYRGALSGEHGDGLVRSWLNEQMFGTVLYQAFIALKKAFDPEGRMNPGKVVATQPLLQNLREGPKNMPETFLDFSREGGLALATDLCNGNGMCRKRDGLMCPSFQAFGDEYHTTRARAQSFRALFAGHLPKGEGLTSHAMYDVLEYCLECKGCKTECPSQVDMAKMKAEFLYHYQQKHGVSWRSRLFGEMGNLYALASPVARLFNATSSSAPAKWLLSKIGITPERPLPALASQRFSSWWASRESSSAPKVVLFNDTYTEFLQPEIGQSTVTLLQDLGFQVIVPPWTCCGRPLISKGLLPQAQNKAQRLVERLLPYAEQSIPIIGLEPSCLSAIRDDYRDLVGRTWAEKAHLVAAYSQSLEEFLATQQLFPQNCRPIEVYLHTHCHQKALVGSGPTRAVLNAIPGVHCTEIDSGCCGLAGSFGYENEHYAFSMQIGEQKLFPAIRKVPPGSVVIANGMSCRSQIQHGTHRQAIHLAQFLESVSRSRSSS